MNSRACTTIGEIASVYDGPHATPKKIESGPIFLSISSLDNGSLDLSKSAHISESDFQKWTKRITPEEGDILFSYETRLGEAALMPPNITACLGRRMGLLRPNREKVLPEYLLYAYLSPGFQEVIRSKTIHGATVDRIALKELPSFPITIPSLEQQKNIVQQLKTLDKKTNCNKVISSLLEQIAQTIFKSWFVDFEPTKAKINAREALLAENPAATPEQIATVERQAAIQAIADAGDVIPTEQLQTIADLFPNQLVESELGEIPDGWRVNKVENVITRLKPKKRYTKKQVEQHGKVPVFEQGAGILSGYHNGTAGFNASPEKPMFIFGDHTCVTHMSCGPFDISANVIPLEGYNFPTLWVYQAVKDLQKFQEYRRHWSEFVIKQVVTPATALAELYSRFAKDLVKMKEVSVAEVSVLTQVRDSLLPQLLSGRLLVDGEDVK